MPKRLVHLAMIFFAAFTMLGAANPANRFDKLGHSLMCTCSCGEILLECNHVGCPTSGPMIEELKSQLAGNQPDKTILGWFASKYGPIVLASPIRGGFDLVAWIVPFAVLSLGIVGVIWLVRHWRERNLALASHAGPVVATHPDADAMRERIRRETTYES